MSQPEWECVGFEGTDCLRLYRDKTGVYEHELEYADELPEEYDETEGVPTFELSRVELEQFVLDDNARLVNVYGHKPWFEDDTHNHTLGQQDTGYCAWCCRYVSFDLSSAADTADIAADDLRLLFCSDDPLDRAEAVQVVAGCYGWVNFDGDPQRLAQYALRRRWRTAKKEK